MEIKSITKISGNIKILDNISCVIQDGSVTGLAGPSGSGKSTLLRCLMGLESPDSGSVICSLRMGFVFQDFQLFPHMSVVDNLIYAPMRKGEGEAEVRARANSLMKDLGIFHKSRDYPINLSGGQKQRVALARSLMIRPDLLLCDEPTSGLDFNSTNDVISLLDVVKSNGVSLIVASHDLDFIIKIVDRVILLKEGSLVLDFNPRNHDDPISYIRSCY